MTNRLGRIYFGADYNPDQWSEQVWNEDIKLMKEYNVNLVTLPVFSWAKLQPSENEYNFQWLDNIIDMLFKEGIHVNLATPTAAHPAWMSKRFPDILPVDIYGRKRKHGGRTNFCPNSENYRRLSRGVAEKMAQRYRNHPAVVLWHVNNEYGTKCYCEKCAEQFRNWLKKKYGTLDNLNRCWYTAFWGHTYYEWDEIEVPSTLNEVLPNRLKDRHGTNFQGMAVDYNRFMSDSLLHCYKNEAEVIKKYMPNVEVTTNIWGVAQHLDLFKWGKEMDIVSWDNYPSSKDHYTSIAFRHEVIRGLKKHKPFLLMEQTPNQQNWQEVNALKPPGIMRLLSYQALAHGSDSVMFFQWRQSRGACEKYHASMVPHVGHTKTRIGRELLELGNELKELEDAIMDSTIESKGAIIVDWNSWWALEYSSGPSVYLKYLDIVEKYYRAFNELNISVDIINPNEDLSKYKIVAAPVFYMVEEKVSENIKEFVSAGGTFITTFLSGMVDENDLVILGGYPGAFKEILGIWVEETDALYADIKNSVVIKGENNEINREYKCGLICDIIHCENAKVIGNYKNEYYAGYPCMTENSYGKGKGVYIGTDVEIDLLQKIIKKYCLDNEIKEIEEPIERIEVTERKKGGKTYLFILNHNDIPKKVKLSCGKYFDILRKEKVINRSLTIDSKDVFILEKET